VYVEGRAKNSNNFWRTGTEGKKAEAAKRLEFERAAAIRDKIREIRDKMIKVRVKV